MKNKMTESEIVNEKEKLIKEAKKINFETLTSINELLSQIEIIRASASDRLNDIVDERRKLFKSCSHSATKEVDGSDRGYVEEECQLCGRRWDRYYGTKCHEGHAIWFKHYSRDIEQNENDMKLFSGDYC